MKKRIVLLLVCVTALIFSLAILLPSKPDVISPETADYVRSGHYINGTETWTITEIDAAYFSHLRNYTTIKLEVYGNLSDGNAGEVYINDHFVGTANVSQGFNEWNVPVGFCDETTVIKIVSEGWNVQYVHLLFYVEVSEVSPWWKQNVLLIFLLLLSIVAVLMLCAKRVIKWIKTEETSVGSFLVRLYLRNHRNDMLSSIKEPIQDDNRSYDFLKDKNATKGQSQQQQCKSSFSLL